MVAGSNKDSKPQECLALYQSMFNHTRDAIPWFDCEGGFSTPIPPLTDSLAIKGTRCWGRG